MNGRDPKLAIVAGEESGQLLAAELVEALERRLGRSIALVGVGGARLADKGLASVFDPAEIALMGISDVVASLPRLIRRIGQTADAIIAARPDCLILVDSPDFSLRVARRVRARAPDIPIVKYVAPTVWAWRPERAARMRDHVDQVLAVLPFEPQVMAELGGPETHYVGHRLMADEALSSCWQARRQRACEHEAMQLLVLPGSRRSEIRALLDDFRATAEIVKTRLGDVRVDIPTLPSLERQVRDHILSWSMPVRVTTGRAAQIGAYRRADAALCASGTVTLELALAGVPAISCYRADRLMRLAMPMITTWTAALPNIIADAPVIPEYYNEMIRPGYLARMLEELRRPDGDRVRMMMAGYARVRERMAIDDAPAERAAELLMHHFRT
ncbi:MULTISPECIES: lipid-A-disaccharide synthase [unclassified Roseitalea]|uniref:lipid-A-disaccharide synthase n=1 Tax=unclassified Roseitalea TaxID=2639107 RepID=UPI00273E747C|nr:MULTISPECIES: lipid-A-disaccharide synthase [unclassified Roseitalea]